MYKKILVPLDGSELAECVLPHVEAFMKGFNLGDVILVRVVEPEMPSYHGEIRIDPKITAQREAERESSAKEYLKRWRTESNMRERRYGQRFLLEG